MAMQGSAFASGAAVRYSNVHSMKDVMDELLPSRVHAFADTDADSDGDGFLM
jgi:hypothetical protein